jgi:hypothetical protein
MSPERREPAFARHSTFLNAAPIPYEEPATILAGPADNVLKELPVPRRDGPVSLAGVALLFWGL